MFRWQKVLFMITCICTAEVHTQLTMSRKFTDKYNYPCVSTGAESIHLKIELFNITTTQPYVSVNMSRTTHLESLDLSCRHVPIRFAPYNRHTFEVTEGSTNLPVDYFIKGRSMVLISDYPFDGSVQVVTSGFRYFLMANQGLNGHFLETSLGKK